MRRNDNDVRRGGIAVGIAILAAVLAISLSQLPQPQAPAIEELSLTDAHVDPSLAGLNVAGDAEAGGELPTF